MERPERPSRHSKTHDKWKRIIEPAGDSDSSSDWSTDANCQENEIMLRNSFYDSSSNNNNNNNSNSANNNGDDAGPSTSGTGSSSLSEAREALLSRVRMRSMMPPHDLSSLLARYGSDRLKRQASQPIELGSNAIVDTPSYHLLHHDYAERDADHNSFRELQKYATPSRNRINPSSDYSYFLHSNSPNGERKRSRFHRNQTTNSLDQHTERTSRTEAEDSDRELYIIRLPSPSHDSSAATDENRNDDANIDVEDCRLLPERTRQLKFLRRSAGAGAGGAGRSSSPSGSVGSSGLVYPRSFFGDLAPLSERSTSAIAAARHDAASTSSGEVQVISTAGPSGSTTTSQSAERSADRSAEQPADRSAERAAERSGPGDDEIIVIVEDQHSPTGDSVPAQPGASQPAVAASQPAAAASQPAAAASQPAAAPSQPQATASQLPETSGAEATPTQPPLVPTPAPSICAATEEETLNQHLISLLECPVCTDYMAPPIHQCRRGHLLCSMCKPKLPQCPTCRSRFTDSRNLAMEQVADRLLYPCKNRELETGCVAQLRLKDKQEHEANCEFRAYHCTLPMCSWKGLKDAVYAHSLAMHRDMLLSGNRQEIMVNIADLHSTVYRNWLVSAYGELFRVNFVSPKRGHIPPSNLTPPPRQHVFGCVQFIGPRSGASRYKYTIETRRGDSNRCMRYTRNTHSDLRRCMNIYSAVDCFHMRGEMAELVCERRDGAFHLPVVITLTLNSVPVELDD